MNSTNIVKPRPDSSASIGHIICFYLSLIFCNFLKYFVYFCHIDMGRRGRDHMVVGFTTICVISAYHH
jgi:hypothetical protein